jgi:hypothetical protein
MKIIIITTPESGKIKRNRQTLIDAIKHFEGKEIKISVERNYKKRSNNQNAYLHGYLFPIITIALNDLGWQMTPIKTKEWLKKQFLIHTEINEITGEYMEWVKGTSECTTMEIMEFQNRCIQFASEELGIEVALPNEELELNL